MYTFDADIPFGCDRENRHKQHGEEDHLGVFGASGEEDHLSVFGASGATETQLVREGWVEMCRGTGKGQRSAIQVLRYVRL